MEGIRQWRLAVDPVQVGGRSQYAGSNSQGTAPAQSIKLLPPTLPVLEPRIVLRSLPVKDGYEAYLSWRVR